jgi:hypothetical protein
VTLHSPIGVAWRVARCDLHYEKRLQLEREFRDRYTTHVPAVNADGTAAGMAASAVA